jgi:O-antigen/teichoic acid export membrane protein
LPPQPSSPADPESDPSPNQPGDSISVTAEDAQEVADQVTDILDSQEAGAVAIRGSAVRTGAFLLGLGFSLAAVPFMTRHLGPVDYGLYVAATSIVVLVGGVTEAGLTNLGIRELAVLEGSPRDRLLSNLVGLRLALTIFGVAIAVAVTWATGATSEIVTGVWITGIGVLLVALQQTYVIPLNARLRLGWVSALELLRLATQNGLFITFVIVGAGLVAFFWAQVIAGIVLLGVTLLTVRRTASLRPSFDFRTWRRLIVETLPYAVAAAVGLIYFRLAVVLMSYVSSGHQTGIFSAAFRIVEALALIPPLVVSSVFPILARAARDDHERLAYALGRIFEVALVVGVGLAVSLAVAAPFAIAVVGGHSFEASVPVLRIQSLTLVTSFLLAVWNFGLLALKRYREIMLASVCSASVSVVGTLVLASSFGATGAAAATVAAEAAVAAVSLYFLRRADPMFAPPLGVVPKVLLATALAGGLALALHSWPSVLAASITAFVFAGTVLATRALPRDLLDAMRGRLQRDGRIQP